LRLASPLRPTSGSRPLSEIENAGEATGAGFRAVQWNRAKIIYDAIVLAGVIAYVGAFLAIASWINPPKNAGEAIGLRIQAFGTCAFLMLTVILSIGPLARLDRRFLPLLYNRRHLGVMTFCVVLLHVWFMIDWYLAQNALPNLANELTDWASYGKFIGFPFKVLGIAALLVMFLMAATSHDYWLAFLTPRIWKGLHMAVYVAYGLVAMHVALGAMQDDDSLFVTIILMAAFGTVTTLHIVAGRREQATDRGVAAGDDGWIPVGPPLSIPDKGARIVANRGGERIAVFRDGDRIGAITNLCAHQGGPIGEGCIVDGLVTCPWHGFQYRLEDGCAPPPYTEKLATYPVRINRGMVEVDPRPQPPGTPAAITCRA
jgi:nitrite reductase/ring-hydroxylating ferredoxin subunit/DMSO/TMAO reductase YedYZ heme-binding membrane subunit